MIQPNESDFQKQGEVRTDLIRQSWNLELLISGISLLALFRTPSILDEKIIRTLIDDARSPLLIIYIFGWALSCIIIANLLIHLTARGLWVGMISLRAAYPEANNWKQLNQSPIFHRYAELRVPSLEIFIAKIDRFCSVIFSITFLILITAGFGSIIGGVSSSVVSKGPIISLIVGAVFLSFALLINFTDYLLKKEKYRHWNDNQKLEKILFALNDIFSFITFSRIFRPFVLTFTAALTYKKMMAVIVLYSLILGISPLIYLQTLRIDKTIFLPSTASDVGASINYYENMRSRDETALSPSIQSDIISDNAVRLFIPYRSFDNDSLRARFPNIKTFTAEGFTYGRPDSTSSENRRAAITAIQSLYDIRLNGQHLPDLIFYSQIRGEREIGGIVTFIPLHDSLRGQNRLYLRRNTNGREYYIPFWKN